MVSFAKRGYHLLPSQSPFSLHGKEPAEAGTTNAVARENDPTYPATPHMQGW